MGAALGREREAIDLLMRVVDELVPGSPLRREIIQFVVPLGTVTEADLEWARENLIGRR